jgi:hypothetical protein
LGLFMAIHKAESVPAEQPRTATRDAALQHLRGLRSTSKVQFRHTVT